VNLGKVIRLMLEGGVPPTTPLLLIAAKSHAGPGPWPAHILGWLSMAQVGYGLPKWGRSYGDEFNRIERGHGWPTVPEWTALRYQSPRAQHVPS